MAAENPGAGGDSDPGAALIPADHLPRRLRGREENRPA